MGAAESSSKQSKEAKAKDDGSGADKLEYLEELELSGWKILYIFPASPCDNVGLTPYCDILTHVNRTPIEQHEQSVLASIQPYKPLTLTFFSLATRSSRSVSVTPRPWSGDGLLGLMIRHDTITPFSPLDTLHVLNVHPNSPAAEAGLVAKADYLLGTPRWMFRGFQQLDGWLAEAEKAAGVDTLLVFNSSTWRVREARVKVKRGWGGNGSLGADVAHGWKHRLPLMEEKRPVTMEKRSFVRQGKRSESGLVREDGQLMLNLPLEAGGASGEDTVPLLSIRIREPEEYTRSSYTPHDKPEPKLPPPKPQHDAHSAAQQGHNHSHGGQQQQQHGHSHGAHGHSHAHGAHSHGNAAHAHSHGSPAAHSHQTAAPTAGPPSSQLAAAPMTAAPALASKTTLAAKLPLSRSRDNSPLAGPTPAPASSMGAPVALTATNTAGITISTPGLQPPPSHLTPPFPSLAPQNAMPTFQAGNRAAAAAAAQQDFT